MKSKEKILMLIDQNEFKNTIEMAKRLKKIIYWKLSEKTKQI